MNTRDDTVHAPTQNAVVLNVQLHGDKDDETLRAHSWVYYFEKKYYAYAGATDTAIAQLGQARRQNVIGVLASDVYIKDKDKPVPAAVIVSGIAEVEHGDAKKHTDLGSARQLTAVRINYRNLLLPSTADVEIAHVSGDLKVVLWDSGTADEVHLQLQMSAAMHRVLTAARHYKVSFEWKQPLDDFADVGDPGGNHLITKEGLISNGTTASDLKWKPNRGSKYVATFKVYDGIDGTKYGNFQRRLATLPEDYITIDSNVKLFVNSNAADARAHVVTASSFGGAAAAAAAPAYTAPATTSSSMAPPLFGAAPAKAAVTPKKSSSKKRKKPATTLGSK